ncbi:trypsin inhibitor ClTI-1-like isoform X1 [Scyliorhinus canicula]|uniref:trypsin inhibitor ClTI-1-like isoform X1 n=1 Tax=Scyliorhinus canicula TaxID=7830 RepID=UPI0018F3843F|nr:trypsin inhibitor ClTI-1-like isoform X1 [Scyliorhinus canicula]
MESRFRIQDSGKQCHIYTWKCNSCNALTVHPTDAKKNPDCAEYIPGLCSRERDPVCGTNGITFANECMLCSHNWEYKKDLKIEKNGEC